MNLKWKSPNAIAGYLLIIFTFALFFIIVWRALGGDTTLGVIIGHVSAWVEMFVLFLFRKKNPDEPTPPGPAAHL